MNCLRAILILVVLMTGCARIQSLEKLDYRTVEDSGSGDSELARSLHESALLLIDECRMEEAEQQLQQSLLADVSFGPAHNTLGKLYFDQKKFYFAAWEFEHANRVMPGRPEPLNNLGLVYESIGQLDNAVVHYQQAVDTSPDNSEFLGNLIRSRIRRGDRTSDLRDMLERFIFLDSRQSWVDWAKGQLASNKIDESFQGMEVIETLPFDDQESDAESRFNKAPTMQEERILRNLDDSYFEKKQ